MAVLRKVKRKTDGNFNFFKAAKLFMKEYSSAYHHYRILFTPNDTT